MKTNLILKAAVALAIAAPLVANAESQFTTGAGTPITASAHLDFQIIIPKVLFLQVGTGTANATNATINQIAFTVPAANVGDASIIAASALSGELGNGSGDTISYAQIAAAVAVNTSVVALAHPALLDGATSTVTLTPAVGKVMNRDAKWTFTYLNSAVVAPGTYGGVNANNSRVTYTASMP